MAALPPPPCGEDRLGAKPRARWGSQSRSAPLDDAFKRLDRRASPSPASPMVPTPTPDPSPQGGGEWLRFLLPLAGRTDSGRSPERGGGRKVGARPWTTRSNASTSVLLRHAPAPWSRPPPLTPPPKGEGNGCASSSPLRGGPTRGEAPSEVGVAKSERALGRRVQTRLPACFSVTRQPHGPDPPP